MPESILDHDDLTPTQEYFITSLVIVLFGLLYWFLNHGWNANTDLNAAQLAAPQLQIDADGHAMTPIPVNANLAATTVGTTAITNTTASNAEQSSAATMSKATTEHNVAANKKPKPNFQVKADKPIPATPISAAGLANIDSEAIHEKNKPFQPETAKADPAHLDAANNTIKQAQAETAKVATAAGVSSPGTTLAATASSATSPTANNEKKKPTEASSYPLPDGTTIKIPSSGFENDLKIALINKELNKPLTFDKIYFNSGSTVINTKSNYQIRATAALLHNHPNAKILIRGHSDNTGLPSSNVQLSLMRANAMGLALGNAGIDTKRILVTGMGATQPIDTNETAVGRSKNRRIEILITQ